MEIKVDKKFITFNLKIEDRTYMCTSTAKEWYLQITVRIFRSLVHISTKSSPVSLKQITCLYLSNLSVILPSLSLMSFLYSITFFHFFPCYDIQACQYLTMYFITDIWKIHFLKLTTMVRE